ncbi:MAG: AAA family ATPase [Ignavibacteriae bacterium]|nr:AAA family ATPase [Ignavibacteriota bacterium]
MNLKEINIVTHEYDELFQNRLNELKKGKGSIICISGETGFGKTHLLKYFHDAAGSVSKPAPTSVFVQCDAPIGTFKIGNLQPMLPFSRAIEKILSKTKEEKSAEKKFAKSIGMTILATLPIAGEVFYAVKELSKDWRQYKKDKSSLTFNKINTVTAEYYDSIVSFTDNIPLVILIDDIHWCDIQSVELLSHLATNILKIPLLIVVAFRTSILQSHASPLNNFIKQFQSEKNSVFFIELNGFSKEHVKKYIKLSLKNYKDNEKFEEWIYSQTDGIPGSINEFIRYVESRSPFDEKGNLKSDFLADSNIPTSVQTAFSQSVGNLSDEDTNILAICSMEGREFTAYIISQLLNTDILTAIKKLRSLQNRTGIIRSVGTQLRYGIKSTTYEFTQAYYHNLFEKSLEYEEYIALHSQIASILRQRYEDTESETLKQEIAPYLAAHSAESGDKETAKSMLLIAAQSAEKFGNSGIIQEYYNNYTSIDKTEISENESNPEEEALKDLLRKSQLSNYDFESKNEIDNESGNESKPESQDFLAIRKTIVDYYHKGNYNSAADLALSYIDSQSGGLTISDKSQLYALIIKSYIESGDLEKAETYCNTAINMIENNPDIVGESFLFNVCSILYSIKKQDEKALWYLSEATRKAMSLPPELKLLTLTNIALLTEKNKSGNSGKYFDAARKISYALNFNEFASDVFK